MNWHHIALLGTEGNANGYTVDDVGIESPDEWEESGAINEVWKRIIEKDDLVVYLWGEKMFNGMYWMNIFIREPA